MGDIGIMEKKLETTILGLGLRLGCRLMMNQPLPFKGLNFRIPIIIPIKGSGFINQGSKLFSKAWARFGCKF